MRFVQILVPDDRRESVIGMLEEREIDYFLSAGDAEQSDLSMLYFPVPTNAVEPVLNELEEAGLDKDAYTVVTDAEFAITEHLDVVEERYASLPTHISPDALTSKAKDLRPGTRSFVWMMSLSAVVATAGLLLESPAVIVGSMVIAPIVSPALTASIGALREDPEIFVDSITMQGYGMVLAILVSTGFGLALRWLGIVPPMVDVSSLQFVSIRMTPGFLSLAVALSAGAAGAYGLATTGSSSIVGVMIAAALIPTAATVGIGLAWRAYLLAAGAFVLLLVNVLSINLAVLGMLSYLGYGSVTSRAGLVDLGSKRRAVVSLLVVGTLLVLLVGTTVATYQQVTFDRQVNAAVTDTLDEDRYSALRFVGTRTQFAAMPLETAPLSVTVMVVQQGAGSYPDLPGLIAERIERRTGRNVSVEVQFTSAGEGNPPVVNRTAPPSPDVARSAAVPRRASVTRCTPVTRRGSVAAAL